MSAAPRPRVLVIGVGSIGTRHCRLIRGMGHPVAGCDTDPAAFERVRKDVPDIEAFTDLGTALASKPDLVVVATAPRLHADHTELAFQAGAHVLCEKPMADTLANADRMIAAAKSAGKALHIGFMNRFHCCIVRAKELVDSGRLGTPLFASADLGSYRTLICSRSRYQATTYGALLLDYTHQLDYVPWILGASAERVYAVARNNGRFDLKSNPNVIAMSLEHENGLLSEIHLDYCRQPQVATLSVAGDEGYVDCDLMGKTLVIGRLSDESSVRETFEVDYDDVYREQFRNFLAATEGKPARVVTGPEGRRSLEIAVAALESIKSRMPVEVRRGT